MKKRLILFGTLVAVFVFGFFLGRTSAPEISKRSRQDQLQPGASNQSTATANPALSRNATTLENNPAERDSQNPIELDHPWKMAAALSKSQAVSVNTNSIFFDEGLDPHFIKLFSLTPSEQSALQEKFADVRKTLEKLEPPKTAITQGEQGSTVITVEPSSTQGGAIYDDVLAEVARIMGKERYAAFVELSGEQTLESSFGYFGNAMRKIVITPGTTESGKKAYEIKDERKCIDSESTTTATVENKEEIEKVIGPIAKTLPANL